MDTIRYSCLLCYTVSISAPSWSSRVVDLELVRYLVASVQIFELFATCSTSISSDLIHVRDQEEFQSFTKSKGQNIPRNILTMVLLRRVFETLAESEFESISSLFTENILFTNTFEISLQLPAGEISEIGAYVILLR